MRRGSCVGVSVIAGLSYFAADTAASADTGSVVIEDVIVTASKRDVSLQDASVSVTALTGKTLQELNVREFNDYIELVPGLSSPERTAETNGPRTVGLRGVQSLNGTFSVGQNTVGFYIDDAVVPISNPRLVDLDRVEVLRGPQGTLYGSAALAGTVKLVTAKPDFERWSGRLRADVSGMSDGGDGRALEGVVNIPVSDSFAMRLSGYAETTPGYVDLVEVDLPTRPTGRIIEDSNESDAVGGRLIATWQASDAVSVMASHMYSKVEVDNLSSFTRPTLDGRPLTGCLAFNQAACPDPTLAIPALTGNASDRSDPKVLARFRAPSQTEFNLTSLTFKWSLGSAELVSSTSYYKDEGKYQTEITDIIGATFGRDLTVPSATAPFFAFQPRSVSFHRDLQNTELTHETRLLSMWDKPFNYTVGVFYTDRDEDFITTAPLGVGTSLYGAPNLSADGSALATDGYRGRKEVSVFGELTYAITDRLGATLGGRFYEHDFEMHDTFTGNPLFVGAASGRSERSDAASQNGTLGSVKVAYRPNDESLVYASLAEGFRMGGAVFRLPEDVPSCQQEIMDTFGSSTVPRRYEPDDLVNYEIGWKQTWSGGRATSNLSAFFIDWKNTQVIIPQPVCNITGFPVNAGSVESKGVELESQLRILPSLGFGLSLAYVDSEVTEALTTSPNVAAIAVPGDRLPGIPEWSGSLSWDYSVDLSSSVLGYLRGFFSYRGETVVAIGNNANVTDSYRMLNVRLGAAIGGDSWDVALYVNNALDERPSLTGPIALDPEPNAFRNAETTLPPRTYGVSVTKTF